MLHAVDVDTGQAVWTFETEARLSRRPLSRGTTSWLDHTMGAFNGLAAATGKLRWKLETHNYVHATPAISDGIAYFGGCDEMFRGVRISDGVEVVSLSAGAYTAASPAISGGRAYFGTFNNEVLGSTSPRRTFSGGTNTSSGTFRSTHQPERRREGSTSAGAIGWCTRSTN